MIAVKRFAVLGLAIVVVVAGISLLFMARSSSPTRSAEAVTPEPQATPVEREADLPPPRPVARPAPPVAAGDAAAEVAEVAEVREFVRDDGTVVRDHRQNASAPDLTGAIPRPPSMTLFTSGTMRSVRNAVYPLLTSCGRGATRTQPGEQQRVRVDALVNVEAGTLSLLKLTLRAAELEAADLAAIEECVRTGTAGLTLSTDGQRDVSGSVMSLNLPVRW